ncbi:hypothetical protein chiPu_0033840, partial [Chiloscyllium punctatum]|nr:hypothetical protein [Chiloscyllium punctatum]
GARVVVGRVLQHAGLGCAVQPGLDLCVRRLEQVRRADGACALWPPRAGRQSPRDEGRPAARAVLGRRQQAALRARQRQLGQEPDHAALGGHRLAGAGRHRERAARAGALAAREHRREEPVHRRRRRVELRGERADRTRGRLRERLDPARRR